MALTNVWMLTLLTALAAITLTMAAEVLPKDCSEVIGKNGLYYINPDGKGAFRVYCDMKTDGGGWTVFQRRKAGKRGNNFERTWAQYKKGFGNLKKSFWLGNKYIHRLTAKRTVSLRVELGSSARHFYATYSQFAVSDEQSGYKLTVRGYKGNAGDALRSHNSMTFSTVDKDTDQAKRNCAEHYHGGWWYHSCLSSNLNGKYSTNKKIHGTGIVWLKGKLTRATLKSSEMKLRPVK